MPDGSNVGWIKAASSFAEFALLIPALIGVAVACVKAERLYVGWAGRHKSPEDRPEPGYRASLSRKSMPSVYIGICCIALLTALAVEFYHSRSMEAMLARSVPLIIAGIIVYVLLGPIYGYFRDEDLRPGKGMTWLGRALKHSLAANLILALVSLAAFFWKVAEFALSLRPSG